MGTGTCEISVQTRSRLKYFILQVHWLGTRFDISHNTGVLDSWTCDWNLGFDCSFRPNNWSAKNLPISSFKERR